MHDSNCSCEHQEHDNENTDDGNYPRDVPLPEPSIVSLVSGLAAQAAVSMGVFPNPATGNPTMMLHQAKHIIDTVGLILEKTKGNLSGDEFKTIDSVHHELRMLFVAAQNEKTRREKEANG